MNKKTRCSGTMTDSQFFGWIRSALRRMSIKWKPKNDYLLSVRSPYVGNDKRTKWVYECQECYKKVKRKEYEVNHKIPCNSLRCFEDLPEFVRKLFCEMDGYEGLCVQCHKIETLKFMEMKRVAK